ncbi:hypothetical protein K503DRAFT_18531 [Rhizopogon vinicolor AM-OR11-026]|uniref:Uncharacterized protein n=1 Tax=Rhizopogon vinicolor AM-OR11-026 TaxID=1314800 RepID=A0A1B7NGI8_9AGAM|nr:hypothetical protein K503DRAFT_18531 [Rhizopogon vinicolor AM-OR11-026]
MMMNRAVTGPFKLLQAQALAFEHCRLSTRFQAKNAPRTMDKSSKDHYIQAYLERQKAYVHSYTSEALELHQPLTTSHGTPTGVRHQDAKIPNFGFDTPVLLPRVTELVISPSTDRHHAKATQKARKAHDAGTSGKENKGSEHTSLNAIQYDSSKRKRKKGVIPSGSDDEHEARLSERRARKRVKRAIVKPDTIVTAHISPAPNERVNKKVPRKKGKKHSGIEGLALLHGLSATNVPS